jgi:uncharacterized membrane protein
MARETSRLIWFAKQPIHPMLLPVPIVCFVGTLLTDLTYWWTADMMWADFSAWLVTVGVITGWLAALAWLIDFLGGRLTDEQSPAWPRAIGSVVALVLATLNMLVHTHDAWTSVVPWGSLRSITRSILPPLTASDWPPPWRSSTSLTVHLRSAIVRNRTSARSCRWLR